MAIALNVTVASNVKNDLVHSALSVLVENLKMPKVFLKTIRRNTTSEPKLSILVNGSKMPSVQMSTLYRRLATNKPDIQGSCSTRFNYVLFPYFECAPLTLRFSV